MKSINQGRVIVEPDDFERGMLVTVYRGDMQTGRHIDEYGSTVCRIECCASLKGIPLKIQAVSLPYVVVRTEDVNHDKVVIDSRKVQLSRVDMDYVQAINAPRPARKSCFSGE